MAPVVRIVNRNTHALVIARGRVAANPWRRLIGLMGKRTLAPDDGLLLRGEKAIHTFGMFIPIDVVYLDARGRILRADQAMPPNRVGPLVRGVQDVLELPAGTLARTSTRVGDELEIQIL